MQFIDLKAQSKRIEEKVFSRFKQIMAHGAYVMGPEMEELEAVLAEYLGVKHALTVSSGTDALMIALMAVGIGPGDEVITSPFSFFATAEIIMLLGAKPVFVDIVPDTYNIDVSQVEAAITPKTKAIIPVNMYGQCADMDELNAIAARHALPVIEDAAQSFGAQYMGRFSGALGTIGCTSFFPSKPFGCYGDGGACFTNDDDLARIIKEIRVHGQSGRYCHVRLGVNGRFDTMQAAVLLEKLTIFPEEMEMRQRVAERYVNLLPERIKVPVVHAHNLSTYAQYTIEVDARDDVQAAMGERGIPTAVHYPRGLHEQPAIKHLYSDSQRFPRTFHATRHVLSLPMHPYLTMEEQQKVTLSLSAILDETLMAV